MLKIVGNLLLLLQPARVSILSKDMYLKLLRRVGKIWTGDLFYEITGAKC